MAADSNWDMCSGSRPWWHEQCRWTCAKCVHGDRCCQDNDCDVPCEDRKSSQECIDANRYWDMCSSNDAWWHDQCMETCGHCTVDASAEAMTTPSQICDLHCANIKLEAECQDADASWNMCSVGENWWQTQCKAFCGMCEDGLEPCEGDAVSIVGDIDLTVDLNGAYDVVTMMAEVVTDVVARSAMQRSVAVMAGNGVEATDVNDLFMNFSSTGRRLVTERALETSGTLTSGTLHVSYNITVPSSISSSIITLLQSREIQEVVEIFRAQTQFLGDLGDLIVLAAFNITSQELFGTAVDVARSELQSMSAFLLLMLWQTFVWLL